MPSLFNYKNCIQAGLWECCVPAPQPQMPLGWTSGSRQSSQRRKYTSSCYSRLILFGERGSAASEPSVECVKYAYGKTGDSRKSGNRFDKIMCMPVVTARVDGLCVTCTLPGDKEHFGPELPYISAASMFLQDTHFLIHFSAIGVFELHRDHISFPGYLFSLKCCPGNFQHHVA